MILSIFYWGVRFFDVIMFVFVLFFIKRLKVVGSWFRVFVIVYEKRIVIWYKCRVFVLMFFVVFMFLLMMVFGGFSNVLCCRCGVDNNGSCWRFMIGRFCYVIEMYFLWWCRLVRDG